MLDVLGRDCGPLKEKKLFLLDMDGTIYEGGRLFSGTLPLLNAIRARGGRYLFLTNNSSASVEAYVQRLQGMGIEATREDFFTSAQATALVLQQEYPGKLVYCMGTDSLKEELQRQGIRLAERPEPEVAVALAGFDRQLNYQKLLDMCELLRRKSVAYLATNPDWVCPTEFGSVPDCGAFAQMLAHSTGRLPRFIGKPEPEMIYAAMEKLGYTKEETVMVGDRIYTDIASGYRAGVDTVFVLSGEGTMEDVEKSAEKPTYIEENVRTLLSRI
jgi:HAD superfamily hydrolase (TIGR01457 family)